MKYRVECGMRKAGNFPACTTISTIFRVVEVKVNDPGEVGSAAIDECYRQWKDIEHVKPLRVFRQD